jgi:lysophospholipase L1-like esterase
VVISSTALPVWVYVLWLTAVAGSTGFSQIAKFSRRFRVARGGMILAATLALIFAEARYHRSPRITIPKGKTIYVLGDSLSAGMAAGERCWPAVLEDLTGVHVMNLAQAGATTASASNQAKGITRPRSVVIVEIGGNDLLGGIDARSFHNQLEALISSLRANGHGILMFELPLFPFKNEFGKAQRDIAAKFGATLLPKRFLTRVLGMRGGTLDGLHLAPEGHNELAAIVAGVLDVQKVQ